MRLGFLSHVLIYLLLIFSFCRGQVDEHLQVIQKALQPIRILEGMWGTESGEFGLVFEGEGHPDMPFGPSHFAVDKQGHIYVADKYNARIEVFNNIGNLVEIILVDKKYLNRIIIDADGNLYGINDIGPGSIYMLKYDSTVHIINDLIELSVSLPKSVRFGVQYDMVNRVLLFDYTGSKIYSLKSDGEAVSAEKLPFFGFPSEDAYYNCTLLANRSSYQISRIDNNKQTYVWKVMNNDKIKDCEIIGIKHDSLVYIVSKENHQRYVYVLNTITDALVEKICIMTDRWHGGYRLPIIGLDGNIYYMGSSKDKFWIDKYPLNNE